MSALDIAARGQAKAALSGHPARFDSFAARSVARGIDRIASSGYGATGKGAATYVSDALCTAALLAAHPRFVVRTANGRIFRLLPLGQAVSVEQGGAVGDGASNDQPAIQATIAYAEAVGIGEVAFDCHRYAIWTPLRTSPALAIFAADGEPLVVRRSLTLRGRAANRTVLDFKGLGGADPQTSWQLVPLSTTDPTPTVWRGDGLFILGDPDNAVPDPPSVARLELNRLVLRGNCARTGSHSYPVDTVTGDGWDLSHKGLRIQDTVMGDLVLVDTDMIGWRGEILYLGGFGPKALRMERVRLLTTNGDAFNPGVICDVTAIDCEFGDAFQAHEDTGKRSARYINCLWRDCLRMNLGSGPTSGYQYTYLYPTRDNATQPPITQLEACEFRNVGSATIGCWVRGRVRTTDSTVLLDANPFGALHDIDLDIEAQLDQKDLIESVILYGPETLTTQVNGAPAGTWIAPPSNIHIRLRQVRTKLARQNGRRWFGVRYGKFIDKSCSITIDNSEAASGSGIFQNSYPEPAMPRIAVHHAIPLAAFSSHGSHSLGVLSADRLVYPMNPLGGLDCASNTRFNVTLPAYPAGGAAYGYAEGQTFRLCKLSNTGELRFGQNTIASMAMQQSRVLRNESDWIEFAYNELLSRWEETGFYSSAGVTLFGTFGPYDPFPIAPGGVLTLPVGIPGVALGDTVTSSLSVNPSGLMLSGAVVSPDNVAVTLFNPTASAIDLPTLTVRAKVEKG